MRMCRTQGHAKPEPVVCMRGLAGGAKQSGMSVWRAAPVSVA